MLLGGQSLIEGCGSGGVTANSILPASQLARIMNSYRGRFCTIIAYISSIFASRNVTRSGKTANHSVPTKIRHTPSMDEALLEAESDD